MKEIHKIDELFKKGLTDYSEKPSEKTKEKIFGRLAYYQYLKWVISSVLFILISGSIWAILNFLPYFSGNTVNSVSSLTKTYSTPDSDNNNSKTEIVITSDLDSYKNKDNKISGNHHHVSKNNIQTKTTLKSNNIQASDILAFNDLTSTTSSDKDISIDLTTEMETDTKSPINTDVKVSAELPQQNKVKSIDSKIVDEINFKDELIKKNYIKPFIRRFEILLSGNIYYVDKKLTAGSEYQNLLKIREVGEKPILTFSPALEVRYNFNTFFVQSGIQCQKYGEKTDFQTSEIVRDINSSWYHRDSLYYVKDSVNPPGAWHIDTIWFVTYDTVYHTNKYSFHRNNSYKYFEIPFLLGKRIILNNFSLEVSTGVSLGFLLKSDAEIIATDGKSTIILNDENSPYFKSLMINYLLRFSVRYNLSKKWGVFISPNFKYNIGSIFNEKTYPIKQNYLIYGISSGLIYKL